MTQFESLIQHYCPEGVRWVPLEALLDYEQPTKYIVSDTNYDETYSIPVLTAGQSFILGYTDETDGVYKASNQKPVIIFDDFTTSFHWVNFDFKVKSSAMKMLTQKTNDSFRYIYYAMKTITFIPSEHTRHWITKYSQFEIPLPPLPIQEKIVEILDKFSTLSAELEKELEKRKKQYEYYRTRLLSFDSDSDTVVWKTIHDIADTFIGLATSVTKWKRPSGVLLLHNSDISTNQIIMKQYEYLDPSFVQKNAKKVLKTGDIITVHTGNVGTSAVINEAYNNTIGFTTISSRVKNKNEILNTYLCHYLNSDNCKKAIAVETISDRNNLNLASFDNLLIPIPPLAEQERIVAILDKFEALVTDLSQGLPAEIQKVQQQYEYYRNLLLNFEK